MKETKNRIRLILGIIILIISIVLTIGVKTLFSACGVHEDGAFSSCHFAEQAVFAMGILFVLESILLLIMTSREAQIAISACIGCGAVIGALIPNVLIHLCMMPTMRCLTLMQPIVIALCCAAAIVCGINLWTNRKKTLEKRN